MKHQIEISLFFADMNRVPGIYLLTIMEERRANSPGNLVLKYRSGCN